MNSTLFHDVYEICTERFGGAFVPHVAAKMIAERSGLDAATVEAALTSPSVFLYPDVLPTLDQILNRPGVVPVIWTEGQLTTEEGGPGYQMQKVRASGLLARYTEWTETTALGLLPVIGGMTKINALPQLADFLAAHVVAQILVVDDNPTQLVAAGTWLSENGYPVQLLHIDRSEDEYSYPLAEIRRIHTLAELIPLLKDPGPHLILFDLDYTLIDHAQTRKEMSDRIEQMMIEEK
ncbi:hypothetical protein GC175_08365 [bacterium]|nr:hypothetical protein [bacterium]